MFTLLIYFTLPFTAKGLYCFVYFCQFWSMCKTRRIYLDVCFTVMSVRVLGFFFCMKKVHVLFLFIEHDGLIIIL